MKQALGLILEAQQDREQEKEIKKKCLETFDCSELREPRDKNANVMVYQEWKCGGKKLQGRVADRTHTSGCAMQHNTRTERFTVYAYQQMMKPCPTTKHGTGFAMVLQGDALHFEIR